MNTPSNDAYVMPRWLRAWEQFWFTPADPTVLALIRISCGMIVVYTMFVYSFKLQEFMGEHAWHDLKLQMERVEERPMQKAPLNWTDIAPLPDPKTEFEKEYVEEYTKKWRVKPPPPYPTGPEQAKYLDEFRKHFGVDLRVNGLKPSDDPGERAYAENYTGFWMQRRYSLGPPPAYAKDEAEAQAIQEYIFRWGVDPRRLYAKGQPIFSFWFHVTDPAAMEVVHSLVVIVAFLFTLGFCTRFTSALTWFASLCYIHRNPTILFGVDTMMTILLFYLMMSPCGVVYSLDHSIRVWWTKAKPGVVQWFYHLIRWPMPVNLAPAEIVTHLPAPSIGANVAIRLLQIHVCIIYGMAGLSKLQGQAWWNGGAIWMTLGNYEFAPMQFELYLKFLRFLGSHQLLYDAVMTGGAYFTLVFEVGYPFVIWRPRLRWVFLSMAIVLHGGIGLFMGLKTFSLMMLVMNMAFLHKEEANWLLSLPGKLMKLRATQPANLPAPAQAK